MVTLDYPNALPQRKVVGDHATGKLRLHIPRYLAIGLGLWLGLGAALGGDETATAPAPRADVSSAPTPRMRLQRAIAVCRELAEQDEEVDVRELMELAKYASGNDIIGDNKGKRFPRESHYAKYMAVRSWSYQYDPRPPWGGPIGRRWPGLADAAALRGLLDDKNPDIRAMAAEALATLHRPEDVPRLARLLGDGWFVTPRLEPNSPNSHLPPMRPRPAAPRMTNSSCRWCGGRRRLPRPRSGRSR
jgi:hypothetical protein